MNYGLVTKMNRDLKNGSFSYEINENYLGRTPANILKDYTCCIPLSSSNVLVFNCLTGKSWKGAKETARIGKEYVEDYQGHVPAYDRILQFREEMTHSHKPPLSIVLIPTYGCNLSCSYCYEGKLTFDGKSWKLNDVPNIIKACQEIINFESENIANAEFIFLGGEPIQKHTVPVVKEIIKELKKHNVTKFFAITNGFELKDCAEELSNLGLSGVMVTVDGPHDIHDSRRPSRFIRDSSFERAIASIEECLYQGLSVTVRVNIDQRNLQYLGDLADIFESKGLFNNPLFSSYIYPVTSDFAGKIKLAKESELAHLLVEQCVKKPKILRFRWELHGLHFLYALRKGQSQHPKIHFCGANSRQYVMDMDFNLFTCWFGVNKPGFQIGRFHRSTGTLSIETQLLHDWHCRNIANIIQCQTCKWALLCGGGCGFKAFERTGKINSPNCADFASIFEACGRVVYESIL